MLTWAFKEIWYVDFEYVTRDGERPGPVVCMVAREARSNRLIRVWKDELLNLKEPPFDVGPNALFVAFFASAEFGCFLALNWSMPFNVLDLFVEFRNHVNGLPLIKWSLIGALAYFGLGGIDALEKKSMISSILTGGPWSTEDQRNILDYCQNDVDALPRLLAKMKPEIDLDRALIRGRYMISSARMEWLGVPIDTQSLDVVDRRWSYVKGRLIENVNDEYGVFQGGSFRIKLFEHYLTSKNICWPRLETGVLDLKEDTFKTMSVIHPEIAGLRETRKALSKMRLNSLTIGRDGRNRCLLSPFSSKSSRNQPSSTKFIFGPDTWVRSFIKPNQGKGLAYIDFSANEFAIAAALSGDEKMIEAYQTGDPYIAFAKQIRMVPEDATKETHGNDRENMKTVVLGTNYGMGANSLAFRINKSEYEAKELLRLHKETYKKFLEWRDGVVDQACLHNKLWTVFGWYLQLRGNINIRSVMNYPMQANGAEILRLAIILAFEVGVDVIAPVHDALLIEFDLGQEDEMIAKTQAAMGKASRIVLNGFEIKTDVVVVRYPDRYQDKRGVKMWDLVWKIIREVEPQS